MRYNYLPNNNDQFWYGYEYDADNRIINATTGVGTVSADGWEIENPHRDASYQYYLHGPLARQELGHGQLVQGVDFAYTLQGWTKFVNGQYLSPVNDMGGDGRAGDRSVIGPDIYAFSLDYFKGDYKPISTTGASTLPLNWSDGVVTEVGRNLYNGNISRSTMALSQFNNVVGYSYRYDQLNRLNSMRTHAITAGANSWSAATAGDAYQEDVTYDGNGNILTYQRNGSKANSKSKAMDNLTYGYQRDAAGNLLNNKLLQVKDAVTNSEYANDLRSQNDGNYIYDNIGNLVKDNQAGISNIAWTVYGKIKSITNSLNNTSLEYQYDAAGNRTYKGYTHDGLTDKTWYVRDAQGNVLAVYGNENGDNGIYWKEQDLYGSDRLGVWSPDIAITDNSAGSLWDMAGKKRYELSNHLGNVMSTIGDYLGSDNKAVVFSAQDYYPFGMAQVDRTFNLGEYRYGFNGKENDNEVKGEGGQQDYGMRVYDPRLGKFLSVDPLTKEYPWNSTYAYAENDVIRSTDLDGAEKDVRTFSYYLSDNKPSVKVTSDNYVQPQGTSNIGSWFGLKPETPKERVARGLVSSYHLPDNGTLSFFEFGAGIDKENYARYDYDIGGKQQTRYFEAGNIAFMYDYYGLEDKTGGKILNVAVAGANLVGAGMLVKAELSAAASEIPRGGIHDVNFKGGRSNCAGCTIAGDATLKGFPASALNHGIVNTHVFFKEFGGTKGVQSYYTAEGVINVMSKLEDGATGVIFGSRGIGPGIIGHYFNVTKQHGNVIFLDFQNPVGSWIVNPSTLMKDYKFKELYFKNTTVK